MFSVLLDMYLEWNCLNHMVTHIFNFWVAIKPAFHDDYTVYIPTKMMRISLSVHPWQYLLLPVFFAYRQSCGYEVVSHFDLHFLMTNDVQDIIVLVGLWYIFFVNTPIQILSPFFTGVFGFLLLVVEFLYILNITPLLYLIHKYLLPRSRWVE